MDQNIEQLAILLAMGQTPMPDAAFREQNKLPAELTDEAVWKELVAKKARTMLLEISNEESPLAKSVAVVRRANDKNDKNFKPIWTTIENVELDPKSQRVTVTFRGRPTAQSADGREIARTERLDSYFDARGRLMAREARELIGHRVVAYIEVETIDGGKKVRMLRHLVDRGMATDKDFEPKGA